MRGCLGGAFFGGRGAYSFAVYRRILLPLIRRSGLLAPAPTDLCSDVMIQCEDQTR